MKLNSGGSSNLRKSFLNSKRAEFQLINLCEGCGQLDNLTVAMMIYYLMKHSHQIHNQTECEK